MLEVATPGEMDARVGTALGTGDWLLVDQAMIDGFARATGDDQWIHVDVARAAAEMPGGRTIAHGYLTLSLLPLLGRSVFAITRRSRALNYGVNRVRFTQPVPSGSRVRVHQVLVACEAVPGEGGGGRRLVVGSTVEIEGVAKPALVAETVVVVFE